MKNSAPEMLRKNLDEILEFSKIKTVFQPIMSLRDGRVLGYEALSRGPIGTPLQNPDAMFTVAKECGKLWELEQLCRSKALETVFETKGNIKLFLNVNPYVIHDEKFKRGFTIEYLQRFNIDPDSIIFEITEHSAVDDINAFKRTIDHYKEQNYKIAIDDAGAGYSGLNMIADIHPHYIKLDMNLIRDIDSDELKKSLVKSLQEFARISSIHLIAEGIETLGQLNTLIDIGVSYGQGFFIQRPDANIKPIDSIVLSAVREQNSRKNHVYFNCLSNIYIGNLCRENKYIKPGELAQAVYNIFLEDSALTGVTVIDDGKVHGMITRERINSLMSGQYGYSLHAMHSISDYMDCGALTVDFSMPIDMAAKLAMSRLSESLYDFIIVTRDSRYCGVVTIKDLLEKTMEIEVSNAKHQNPLSGLPGNLTIEKQLTQCIENGNPFTVLYFDIDNFKVYNDVYGFENGDNVIRLVAKFLCENLPQSAFVGHIGGDDFVAVAPSYDVEEVCVTIIQLFDISIRGMYKEPDLNRGFVTAKNRRGVEEQFPIMTLSIAAVTNRVETFQNIYQLTEKAGAVKKKCKQEWKSCYIIE